MPLVSIEAHLCCFLKLLLWKWRPVKALPRLSQGLDLMGGGWRESLILSLCLEKNILKPMDLKQKTYYFSPNYYFILFWILVKNSEQMPSSDRVALLRMSSDHSPNSLTKEAGNFLTQTLRPPRKIQDQCQQQILPSWQVLALRTCIYIRTMQIK